MTSRRAMTLIETLAALTLLGALTSVLIAWTVGLQRDARSLGEQTRWLNAAERTLDRIDELITTGAFGNQPETSNQNDPPPRVETPSEQRLLIRPIAWDTGRTIELMFDPETGVLSEADSNLDDARLLLGGLDLVSFVTEESATEELDPESGPPDVRLHVKLRSKSGITRDRVWRLVP